MNKLSYEFKSKIIGEITKAIAEKWHFPELANRPIYQFAGIHKHTQKHDNQFELGERSKNYTMLHLRDVINNPDYVCYNIKNEGFEYHKELMEYVVVTVKPSNDDPNIFCVTTIYPSSRQKMENRKANEQKIINNIDKMKAKQ